MKCGFCGYEFDETTAQGCASCPLHNTCSKVRCPNCGFDIPKENRLFGWFRRRRNMAGKGEMKNKAPCPGKPGKEEGHQGAATAAALSRLNNGEEAVISEIDTGDQGTLNKIMALGILPGERVTMIQRYPTFVFQVGNTRVTADENLVNSILIHKQ